jgi:hypothetical protein
MLQEPDKRKALQVIQQAEIYSTKTVNNIMDFKLYIGKHFIKDFSSFKEINGVNTSRVICVLISNFIKTNNDVDIPTIRKICKSNPDTIRKLKELIQEFG